MTSSGYEKISDGLCQLKHARWYIIIKNSIYYQFSNLNKRKIFDLFLLVHSYWYFYLIYQKSLHQWKYCNRIIYWKLFTRFLKLLKLIKIKFQFGKICDLGKNWIPKRLNDITIKVTILCIILIWKDWRISIKYLSLK